MTERKDVFTTLCALEGYSSRSFPYMTVPKAIAWLQGLLDEIPEEWRDNSTFEIDLEHDYDGPSLLNVQVYYSRPETEAEALAREAEEARQKEESKRCEIARLRSNLERLERLERDNDRRPEGRDTK